MAIDRKALIKALMDQGLSEAQIESAVDTLIKSVGAEVEQDPLIKALDALKGAWAQASAEEAQMLMDDLTKSAATLESVSEFSDQLIKAQGAKADAAADLIRELTATVIDLRGEIGDMRADMDDLRKMMDDMGGDYKEMEKSLTANLNLPLPPRAVQQAAFLPHPGDAGAAGAAASAPAVLPGEVMSKALAEFNDPNTDSLRKGMLGDMLSLLESGGDPVQINNSLYGGK